MAFLDNSGDIILDAVLTDTGRLRLAQGDGSFRISKFALGDEEINYGLYNKGHLSGSAYYDLEVLQSPVLEAFTNNTSNLKTKLVTMSRTNVLYMPILKLNGNIRGPNDFQALRTRTFKRYGNLTTDGTEVEDPKHYIAVDKDTWLGLNYYRIPSASADDHKTSEGSVAFGVIQGFTAASDGTSQNTYGGAMIRVDHGLDTTEVSPGIGLDSDLQETAFIVELDYRLGRIKTADGDAIAPVNFIDDDNIATYYLTSNQFVNPKGNDRAPGPSSNNLDNPSIADLAGTSNVQVFEGPRGNTLHFRIQASQELQQSTFLFDQIGVTEESDGLSTNIGGFPTGGGDLFIAEKNTYYIDSTVRVTGANTGFRLDIPIRYVRIAT